MMTTRVISRQLDAHRRLVMPATCPPGAAVTVQALDSETYLVRLAKPTKDFKLVLIPALDKLPDDPDWERKELDAATGVAALLPCPDE